ncbi:MAG: hypothetical protein Kow00121_31180 [Elainellaceae cyanobacterium]
MLRPISWATLALAIALAVSDQVFNTSNSGASSVVEPVQDAETLPTPDDTTVVEPIQDAEASPSQPEATVIEPIQDAETSPPELGDEVAVPGWEAVAEELEPIVANVFPPSPSPTPSPDQVPPQRSPAPSPPAASTQSPTPIQGFW